MPKRSASPAMMLLGLASVAGLAAAAAKGRATEARLREVVDYERVSLPSHRGGRYFFSRNDGLQNQSVLYVTDGLDGTPRELLNPNEWQADGTVALGGTWVSDDGSKMAYGISAAGSDWVEFKLLDVASGEHLEDHL